MLYLLKSVGIGIFQICSRFHIEKQNRLWNTNIPKKKFENLYKQYSYHLQTTFNILLVLNKMLKSYRDVNILTNALLPDSDDEIYEREADRKEHLFSISESFIKIMKTIHEEPLL